MLYLNSQQQKSDLFREGVGNDVGNIGIMVAKGRWMSHLRRHKFGRRLFSFFFGKNSEPSEKVLGEYDSTGTIPISLDSV